MAKHEVSIIAEFFVASKRCPHRVRRVIKETLLRWLWYNVVHVLRF